MEVSSTPLVSIVVLNWNGNAFIQACLEHIQNQTYPAIEMIVVDNASSDDSLEIVRREFPQAKIIANSENVGFANGMNQGILASKGEFVIPLNLDAFLHQDFVAKAMATAIDYPEIGLVAPKAGLRVRGGSCQLRKQQKSVGTNTLRGFIRTIS